MPTSGAPRGADSFEEQFYLKDDLLQTKIVILICFFFVSSLIYGDYLNFGLGSGFYTVVLARAVFLVFSALMLLALRLIKTVRQHDYFILAWSSVFIVMAFFVNVTRPVANINFSYVDTLIVLAIFLVFPSNIFIKGGLAGALTIGDLAVIAFFKNPVDGITFKTIALSYLLAIVLGLFMAGRLQQFRQKQYSAFLQEQSMRKDLEKVAFIDHLTGALNRHKFFHLGAFEFDRCRRFDASFSLVMLDLDFFKKINDEFGHAAGDHYLREFTQFIVDNKRSSDIFGRLGGEEFALLLPDTDLAAALEMAERLRRSCAERCFYFHNQPLKTTVSVGVTDFQPKDRNFQDVLNRADEALYQAKRRGRNQVQLKEKQA